ncbi:UDP-N-acetyl-D-mannosamine dehydrogenase [Desulfosporosinus meridiei]|uniref:Nucleotide sugar dehydrogenase n=1 Tax=Desulfosporosinus meridiei (strain ATCC BAA-275 / DSM 13257 / KCTC 12902 / NCIMB 13706 / S10) TaxID=768704 RepID=J7J3Y0_DESMD|nr:UDP-N-acetyl-D-mannosamine dehydrogenase [Desulfosporosinus meridiei]AFQ45978.1 nucleotide sugar dehydrogenase [Desulfosporosinus meridiei DSM 13257]
MNLTLCVSGLGYIGLPTAAMFAANGLTVIGVDVKPKVVDTINQGRIHIVEPDLEDVVASAVESGGLIGRLDPVEAYAYIIAVPTPFNEYKQPDLRYVEAAALSISKVVKKDNLVILESTVPVGTTERVADIIFNARPDLGKEDLLFAFCPERVLPGKIIHELVNNNRIIGGLSPKAAERAKDLYKVFVKGEIHLTDARTAEMTKLTENAFRDVNIAFANELSLICEKYNINVWNLIDLANKHPRVNILQPGSGVGGHCIAVDPWFIVDSMPNKTRLIRTAREVNDSKPMWVYDRIKEVALGFDRQSTIAFLGLAYKSDIDDLRESPALEIVRKYVLSEDDRDFLIVEPHIKNLPDDINLSHVKLCTLEEALLKATIVVVLVSHSEFYSIKLVDYPYIRFLDYNGIFRKRE